MTSQRLPKRMHPHKHSLLQPQLLHDARPPGPQNTRRMRLVNDEVRMPAGEHPIDDVDKGAQRRDIPVHAVQGLYGDEHVAGGPLTLTQAVSQHALQTLGVAVRKGQASCGTGQSHAFSCGSMDKFIVHDDIAWLRQAGEHADVGVEAGVEEKAAGGLVEGCDLGFERLCIR